MVKVSIRVRNGAACFDVAVQAESVERAVSLLKGRYSASVARVKLLTGPEVFSVDRRDSRTRTASGGSPDAMAA